MGANSGRFTGFCEFAIAVVNKKHGTVIQPPETGKNRGQFVQADRRPVFVPAGTLKGDYLGGGGYCPEHAVKIDPPVCL
jgi:hypothetical protein